ncbi:hypothetical protein D3C72_753980 [compost metagenome]
MKKILKVVAYIAPVLLISIGLVYAQMGSGKPKKDINHRYLEMAKEYMAKMPSLSYDYTYNLYNNETVADNISGRLYKIGQDYVDSNNYYSKVLFGDFYVLYNHQKKTAQYLNIPKLEQQLGMSRSEMFTELFNLPDSSFYQIGKVTAVKSSAGIVDLTYVLNDTSGQIQKIKFSIDEQNKKLAAIELNFRMDQYSTIDYIDTATGAPVMHYQESVLSISNIRPYTVSEGDTSLQSMYFKAGSAAVMLEGKFKSYKLSKL